MPKALPHLLGACAGVLLVSYLALMIAAVTFASVENEMAANARAVEARIAVLETKYYDALERLSATDLVGVGLTDPLTVTYVSEEGGPVLTRAER